MRTTREPDHEDHQKLLEGLQGPTSVPPLRMEVCVSMPELRSTVRRLLSSGGLERQLVATHLVS